MNDSMRKKLLDLGGEIIVLGTEVGCQVDSGLPVSSHMDKKLRENVQLYALYFNDFIQSGLDIVGDETLKDQVETIVAEFRYLLSPHQADEMSQEVSAHNEDLNEEPSAFLQWFEERFSSREALMSYRGMLEKILDEIGTPNDSETRQQWIDMQDAYHPWGYTENPQVVIPILSQVLSQVVNLFNSILSTKENMYEAARSLFFASEISRTIVHKSLRLGYVLVRFTDKQSPKLHPKDMRLLTRDEVGSILGLLKTLK